jgi:hypothetical protein
LMWACTSVLKATEYINKNEELLVANCDQCITWDINQFKSHINWNWYDGALLTYVNNAPKDDFLQLNNDWSVKILVPKDVISDIATVWVYYWKKWEYFLEWSNSMIKKNINYNNEFYIWPVFNENIKNWLTIGTYLVQVDQVWNPHDLDIYIEKLNTNN